MCLVSLIDNIISKCAMSSSMRDFYQCNCCLWRSTYKAQNYCYECLCNLLNSILGRSNLRDNFSVYCTSTFPLLSSPSFFSFPLSHSVNGFRTIRCRCSCARSFPVYRIGTMWLAGYCKSYSTGESLVSPDCYRYFIRLFVSLIFFILAPR